ncbi:MAG TPA: MBL fold metallo-hydrolase [Anaerolineae bacterium]|nr:MBL fold metallo-hydrolase [Anaerolineae bacterium]
MRPQIRTISLSLPYRLGSVNCYLIETDTGFVLIDTGGSNKRADLEKELESAGCMPADLELIVLTHGDFDHTGNCAFLREKFRTKIAMHPDDSGMVERGDMFSNRESGNILFRTIAPSSSGSADRTDSVPTYTSRKATIFLILDGTPKLSPSQGTRRAP